MKAQVEDIYGLSPLQEGILFESQRAPASGVYVEQAIALLRGDLNVEAFEQAWKTILDRHASLRVAILRDGRDRPLQVVRRDVSAVWRREDWRDGTDAERARRFETFLRDDRRHGFDPSVAPLMRFALIRWDAAEWQFVWTFHHLLLDGWSASQVLNEAHAAYVPLRRGRQPDLPPVRPYREFIAWLGRQDAGAAREYWTRALAGFTTPTRLPSDFMTAPAGAPGEPGEFEERELVLENSLATQLRVVCRRRRLTENTVFQGALAILLGAVCGTDDVLFGATVSGRPADLPGSQSMLGLFINTIPMRFRLPRHANLFEWLEEIQRQQAEARHYEHVSLVDVAGWSGLPRGERLFDTLVVFENYPEHEPDAGDPGLELVRSRSSERTNYPLTILIDPAVPSIRMAFDPTRFAATTIERTLGRLKTLLAGIVRLADSPARIADLPLMEPGERERILAWGAGTAVPFPAERAIEALFEEQARAAPDAVAIVSGEETISYAQLDRRAERIASLLHGVVDVETPVGILAERSIDVIAGILGTLKAGGAWIPLDPSYPPERIALMMRTGKVRIVLAQNHLQSVLPRSTVRILPLDGPAPGAEPEARRPTGRERPGGERLACVFMTSGSTGRPKAVAVTHRAIVRLVRNTQFARFGTGERTLLFAPLAFDASLFEIWGPLLNGGTLVVMPPGAVSLQDLGREIEQRGVTMLWLTAPLFHQMVEGPVGTLRGVRQLLAGGDVLSPLHVRKALESLPETRLINGYGPTEGTTFTTCHDIRHAPHAGGSIPIGRPVANTQVCILDREFRPVPIGIPGELCIGGAGLARGYAGEPSLTAEAFVPDPLCLAGEAGGRLYRTGDDARWLEDGTIDFLGRRDQQVKIRGHRIEPAEIEAALADHPAVKEALVAPREDAVGLRRLIAWIVPRAAPGGRARDEEADLRGFLQQRLPAHMIPSVFVFLDAMPLTPSGKPDRTNLPAPELETDMSAAGVAPATPVEQIVAGMWARLLGVETVGRHEDFFELGGHSLLATQVVSRLRARLGVEVSLEAIFEHPTVAALAARVETALREGNATGASPVPPIRPRPPGPPPSLSFAQQRLWFLDRFEPDSSFYNVPAALHLKGPLETGALERALGEIVRRHESLRTIFPMSNRLPVQVIRARAFRLDVEDLAGGAGQRNAADSLASVPEAVWEMLREEAAGGFDLESGPLFRARLLRLGDEEHVLALTMHHIVSDGWSVGVFVQELSALYDAFSRGLPSPLAELPIQYADYAVWQREWLRGEILDAQVGFWKRQLAGAPPALLLPADRPRPASQSFRGGRIHFGIAEEVSRELRRLAHREDVTPFILLMAAFQTLLHRHARQDDIVVGTPVANRTRVEVEGLIGFFVNMLPIRTRFGGDPSFRAVMGSVRRTVLDAWANQDLPFEQLVEALQPPRDPSRPPIFQAMFVMDAAPAEEIALRGLTVSSLPVEDASAKFDLTLSVSASSGEEFDAALEYNADLFDEATARAMVERFQALVSGIAADPDLRISELPILTADDNRRVREDWNDTRVEFPAGGCCLHELIERRAAEMPSAIAVSLDHESLSFGELDERASALARRLIAAGVGADVPVAVVMERSLELVVALLGILKAGGAWLPLDPEDPPARLAFQMAEARCPVVLSQRDLLGDLPAGHPPAWALDEPWPESPMESNGAAARPGVHAGNLAYIIYSSGSTGAPKGVLIPHEGIVNRLLWMQREFRLTPEDRVLQKTPSTFDVSVWEFFWPLLTGARLVFARPDGHRDPAYLARTIVEQGITTAHFVPSLLDQFLAVDILPRPGPLRRVICSGEALRADLQERFFERIGAPLYNLYGPTEASVDVTAWTCRRNDPRSDVPIGRPIANMRAVILDRFERPVPPGVPGELHLAGIGLARGYLNRPDLTAERFIPDPDPPVDSPGGRLYRTGDLARHLPDGTIEYLGRIDHQVKIRGVRIEPGEIESALLGHPLVRESAVVVRNDAGRDARLIGYVVTRETPQPGELRAFLASRLPAALVPAAILQLPEMPLTRSGKLDRKALPAPGTREDLPLAFVTPRSDLEEALARIWGEILGVKGIGATDSLFDLGGHSLLATQILHQVEETFQVDLPLRGLFEEPTVEAQARALQRAEAAPGRSEKIAAILNRVETMSPEAVRAALEERKEMEGRA